jgi:GAF domain-containing protein/ActR/RegA family two-component response regulator
VRVPDAAAALDALRAEQFAAVLADPTLFSTVLDAGRRDALILTYAEKGLAMLDPAGVVTWCNAVLQVWCAADPVGQPLLAALGSATMASDTADPLAASRAGEPSVARLHRLGRVDPEYIDLRFQPVRDASGAVTELLALARDVTGEVAQQKKLDALHQAGRDLADLDISQLAVMTEPERIALLKYNLRRYIHDLLNYDTIEVRLLDKATGELTPLLEDGMTKEAAERTLFATAAKNGVTGHVAFTGTSYLCRDTATDPHYLLGATGARSSLTVPLVYADEVVGTLNVESPEPNAFGADDLQFTELFSKEIAAALHTLDLLTAQQTAAAAQSVEAVNREIALPVDDVLASAAVLLKRFGGDDPEVVGHLRRITTNARRVKDNVRRVGRQGTPTGTPRPLLDRRVLVIEQDERLRRAAHLLLERLGAEAETVGTAAEGLALLADADYDAVLTEVRPVDLGGYDTYCLIREARPGVRVALTTGFGYDAAHSMVKCRQDGLEHVLFKPFKEDQVVRAVLGTPAASPGAPPPGNFLG